MFNVTGIPTLLVFKGGKLVETLVGFMPKDKLLAKLLPHLN
jgi:thioredoxin 1